MCMPTSRPIISDAPPMPATRPKILDRAPLSITFFVVLALVVLSQLYGALVLGPASALDLGADPGTSELVQSLFGVGA